MSTLPLHNVVTVGGASIYLFGFFNLFRVECTVYCTIHMFSTVMIMRFYWPCLKALVVILRPIREYLFHTSGFAADAVWFSVILVDLCLELLNLLL